MNGKGKASVKEKRAVDGGVEEERTVADKVEKLTLREEQETSDGDDEGWEVIS